MRQLFLPACVFLLTWSGATQPDARLSLESFTGKNGNHAASAARLNTRDDQPSVTVTIPRQPDIAVQRDDASADVTLAALDLAVEFPVPSGVVVNNGIPIGIPLPPIAKPVIARSTEEICDTLTKSAQINDLPAPFFIRLLFQESRFNPGVISTAGAQGIAQFMPDTATDMGLQIDWMVHATGSTGTQAGLLAGLVAINSGIKVLGISVRQPKDVQESAVHRLAEATAQHIGWKGGVPRDQVMANGDYVGGGYGVPTPGMVEAVTLTARQEGILLDPVYSGKGMAGLIDLIRKGKTFGKDENVVFLHTGGAVGLFGYRSTFADI